MAERAIDQMTIREVLSATELLARELSEHLQQSFLPKVKELNRSVRSYAKPDERALVSDATVRIQSRQVLESDAFSQQLYAKFKDYLAACDSGADRAEMESRPDDATTRK